MSNIYVVESEKSKYVISRHRKPDVGFCGEGNKAVAKRSYAYERVLFLLVPSSMRLLYAHHSFSSWNW